PRFKICHFGSHRSRGGHVFFFFRVLSFHRPHVVLLQYYCSRYGACASCPMLVTLADRHLNSCVFCWSPVRPTCSSSSIRACVTCCGKLVFVEIRVSRVPLSNSSVS